MQVHYSYRCLMLLGLLAAAAPALAQDSGQGGADAGLGFVLPNVSLGYPSEGSEPSDEADAYAPYASVSDDASEDEGNGYGDELAEEGDESESDETTPASVVSRKIKTSLRKPIDPNNGCGCDQYRGGCCKLDCCGPCLPTLVGRFSWLYMHRSNSRGTPLFLAADGVTPLVNANDFNMGWQQGFDTSLLVNLNNEVGFEVRYLWLNPYAAAFNQVIPVGSIAPTQVPSVLNSTSPISFFYGSKFQSAEWNLRRNLGNFGLLAGFRWAQLDEKMEWGLPVFSDVSFTTRNNLYGFQIGGDGLLWRRGKLKIEGFGKAGIYANDANSGMVQIAGANPYSSASAGHGQCSFLGETGLYGVYPITQRLSLRAGYQLLWLSGIALATDQVGATNNLINTGAVPSFTNAHGSLFYHGANAGLEWCW